MVSHSFWQDEFSQYIELINEGLSVDEIKEKSIEDNYFHQSSKARSKDLNNILRRRVTKLNQDYIDIYPSLQLADKKLINLMSIMKVNNLFEEFMYETYRDELIVGDAKLYDYEVGSFFSRKQQESEQVASWTDQTITRLTGVFKTIVREAGLMKDQGEYDDVIRPFVDYRLEDMMRVNKDNRILSIFLGR